MSVVDQYHGSGWWVQSGGLYLLKDWWVQRFLNSEFKRASEKCDITRNELNRGSGRIEYPAADGDLR